MAKIIYEREECIGCLSCTLLEPDLWEMDDDNKSDLKEGKKVDGKWEREITAEKAKDMEEVVIACPVEIIKIEN